MSKPVNIDTLIQNQIEVIETHLDSGYLGRVYAAERLGLVGEMWVKMGYKKQFSNILDRIETETRQQPSAHATRPVLDTCFALRTTFLTVPEEPTKDYTIQVRISCTLEEANKLTNAVSDFADNAIRGVDGDVVLCDDSGKEIY